MKLTQHDIDKIIGALSSATHKMVKELQQSKLVTVYQFQDLAENAYKADVWLLAVTKLTYKFSESDTYVVTIKAEGLGLKFKITFRMAKVFCRTSDERIAHGLEVKWVNKSSYHRESQ